MTSVACWSPLEFSARSSLRPENHARLLRSRDSTALDGPGTNSASAESTGPSAWMAPASERPSVWPPTSGAVGSGTGAVVCRHGTWHRRRHCPHDAFSALSRRCLRTRRRRQGPDVPSHARTHPQDVEQVVERASKRILRFLQRRGVITLVTAPVDGEVLRSRRPKEARCHDVHGAPIQRAMAALGTPGSRLFRLRSYLLVSSGIVRRCA